MHSLLSRPRNRWLLGIALLTFGTGVTVKNVISYPVECVPDIPSEKNILQRT